MDEQLPKLGYYRYTRTEGGKNCTPSKIIRAYNFRNGSCDSFWFTYTVISFLEQTANKKQMSSDWTCKLEFFKAHFQRLTQDEVLLYLI